MHTCIYPARGAGRGGPGSGTGRGRGGAGQRGHGPRGQSWLAVPSWGRVLVVGWKDGWMGQQGFEATKEDLFAPVGKMVRSQRERGTALGACFDCARPAASGPARLRATLQRRVALHAAAARAARRGAAGGTLTVGFRGCRPSAAPRAPPRPPRARGLRSRAQSARGRGAAAAVVAWGRPDQRAPPPPPPPPPLTRRLRAAVAQVLQDQAHLGQEAEAEPAHPPVDPHAHPPTIRCTHHPVRRAARRRRAPPAHAPRSYNAKRRHWRRTKLGI